MPLTDDQRLILRTNLARDKAEYLLQGLLRLQEEREQAARECHSVLEEDQALSRAIATARSMVERLNQTLAMAQEGLA